MALRKGSIPVRFVGGIDTGQDEKGVAYTKLLALENAVFDKPGVLAKRYGYTSLGKNVMGSATALPDGVRLARRDTELLLFTEDEIYSYQDDSAQWVDADDAMSVSLTHRAVAGSTSEQTYADYDANDGIEVYAWEDSAGGVYFSVLDEDTGKTIIRPTQLDSAGSRPRVQALGDSIYVLYAEDTNGYIKILTIDPSAPLSVATPSPSILVEDLDTTTPGWDLEYNSSDNNCAICWHTDAATIKAGYLHESGVLGRPALGTLSIFEFAATVNVGPVITHYDDMFVIMWWDSAAAKIYRHKHEDQTSSWNDRGTASTVNTGASTIARIAITFTQDPNNVTRAVLYYEVSAASTRDHYVVSGLYGGSGTLFLSLDTPRTQRGCGIASRPFVDDQHYGYTFINLCHETTLYTTYFCQRSDGLNIARFLSGTAGGVPSTWHLPMPKTSGNVTTWSAIYKVALEGANNDVYTEKGIRRVRMDFAAADSHQTAQLGGTTYIAGGGMLQAYDGDSVAEAGFHYALDDVTAPTLSSDSGGLVNGTYVYRFTLEWTNAQGEIVMGPTSAGTTVTISGGEDTVTFAAIPTYRLTDITSPLGEARIGVWRTPDGSATYYRVSSLDPTATGANGYLANDPTADTVTFVDKMSDATLITKEPLYTNGGIPANDPTPTGAIVTVGKNRLFTTDPSDPLLVRYSQELRDGYAVEMVPSLTVKLDPYGGSITGLIVMDDSVVVFKETAVFFFAGPGPLADPNAGGGFSAPQLVTTDVGCKNARSIAYTPVGVVFQSDKGIYLLTRAREVKYIGQEVEGFNSQDIVSTELIEDRTQIRMLTDSGSTLLWDYAAGQWSTFTNHEGDDAIVVDGTYYYLRTDGEVYKEDSTSYLDVARQIQMVIETAWIRFSKSLQGMQRVYRVLLIGEYKSAHTLRVRFQTDYEPGWSAPFDLDPSEFYDEALYGEGVYGDGVYGGAAVERYQFKIHVGKKCEAIRFRIEDVIGSSTGASFELSEILITGGVKRPDYHLGDTRSY